ncbi:hypothetical protein G3I77_22855 [Streptomyces sp. D2-8]|nr:hypothetical protein [Streptomyces sp. D2-8]
MGVDGLMVSREAEINSESPETGASSAGVADLWFDLPPGFMEFDLNEDAEARMLRMVDAVDPIFATATPEQKLSLIVSGEYILQTMIGAGAEHVSSCFLRMHDGELSQGTLCVLIERPDVGPPHQDRRGTAKRTAVQWRDMYPDAEVGLVMLPYGIAAICIYEQDLQMPGVLFGLDGDAIPVKVRQMQVCLPLKTSPGSALFIFMSQDVDHWDEYLDVLSGIMKSISAEETVDDNRSQPDGPE